MKKRRAREAWNTTDEIATLDFMVSDEPRGEDRRLIKTAEKIRRLEGWLGTFKYRIWLSKVDWLACEAHARKLLSQIDK